MILYSFVMLLYLFDPSILWMPLLSQYFLLLPESFSECFNPFLESSFSFSGDSFVERSLSMSSTLSSLSDDVVGFS